MIARLRQVARNARQSQGETKAQQVFDALLFSASLAMILLNLAALAAIGGGQ